MVDAGAERRDQLQRGAGRGEHFGVDSVGNGRHENIGLCDGGHQFGFAEGFVVEVEAAGEKLHHPGFDRVRQLAGNDDK